MHKYLRAIGFSKYIAKKDIRYLLDQVIEDPTSSLLLRGESGQCGYLDKSFGDGFGIRLFGEYDENDRFDIEYYFPYIESNILSSTENCNVERHSDRMAFGGIIDDPTMGISLIFYLNNGIEFIHRQRQTKRSLPMKGVSLNGLCISGKILLPLYKTEKEKEKLKIADKKRGKLLEAAKDGDERAIESLAIEDMNIVQNINRRLAREDIYSIVDTCFMPYGLESDQYSIIGDIQNVEKLRNRMTGEECWRLSMVCNDLPISVMINAADLLGEPMTGRRFKGEIWLQGTAIFDK